MKNIQYIDLVKKSLMITWKNKFLWIFGFFVLLGSFPSNFNWVANDKSETETNIIINFIQTHLGIFIGMIIAFIVLAIIFLILRLIGSASLIKSANNVTVYSQSTAGNILKESKKYVWPLFLLELAIGISLLVIFLVMIVPIVFLFSLKSYILAAILLVGAIIIAIPLFVIAYFLRRFACIFVVLGNMKIRMSLESAYILFKKNVKESLLMMLVLIVTNMFLFAVVLICLATLAIAAAPFGLFLYWMFAKTGVLIIFVIAAFIAGLFLLVLFSWYQSFIQTAWVLFFQKIALEEKKEKRVVEKLEAAVEVSSPEAV